MPTPPSPPSYQTVRLARGKHRGPEEGVCVMELASMLAGEPFSDHPRCVCPLIATFLRAYNDRVNDRQRQDLYRFAAEAVGTRSTPQVQHARVQRCRTWIAQRREEGPWWFSRTLQQMLHPLPDDFTDPKIVGDLAASLLHRNNEKTHHSVLALLDELIALGRPQPAAWSDRPTRLPTTPVDVRRS